MGYDFITDMLVLEFSLDEKKLNIRSPKENLWLGRVAQSIAEAFRFVTSKELDVDFSELITEWRFKRIQRVVSSIFILTPASKKSVFTTNDLKESRTRLCRSVALRDESLRTK